MGAWDEQPIKVDKERNLAAIYIQTLQLVP
jgi:hypothetical protein